MRDECSPCIGNDAFGALWSIVETCIAIVSACLPTLRPVYNVLLYGNINGSESASASSSGQLGQQKRGALFGNLGDRSTKNTDLKSAGGLSADSCRTTEGQCAGPFVRLNGE